MDDETTGTAQGTVQRSGDDRRGRRPDPLALVTGLIFAAVAVIGLTDRVQLSVADLRWLGPTLLVALGVMLVATAAGGRPRGPAPAGEPEPGPDRRPDDRPSSRQGGAPPSEGGAA